MPLIDVVMHLALLLAVWAPLALAALAFTKRLFRDAPEAGSELHALALILGLPVLLVVALGRVGALSRATVFVGLVAVTVAMAMIAGSSACRDVVADLRGVLARGGEALRSRFVVPIATGGAALACGVAAAALLEPWGWDALGYHLPIVYDALQSGRFGEVVSHVPYVDAYPKGVEAFFVAFTLTLPDDRLIELGQVPFALAGVAVIAVMARRAGADARRALGYASAWLGLPGMFLQLAQNYVDVAHAALLLLVGALVTGPVTRPGVWTTGLSFGLLLASKPSAPAPFALLGALWLARSWGDSGLRVRALVALLVAGLLGGVSYLGNLIEHGNPVYPVALNLGPLRLPGGATPEQFFGVGTPPGFAQRGWIDRLVRSWLTVPETRRYVYDMRLGWHGPAWWVLLPLAASLAWRRLRRDIALPVLSIAIATLATPAAFWPRFTLALPGALLALAAVVASRVRPRVGALLDAGIAGTSLLGLVLAFRGLTGGGPALFEIARTPTHASQVSADGQVAEWIAARQRVRMGRRFVHDESLELPGVLWRPDRTIEVRYVPGSTLDGQTLEALRASGIDALAVDRNGAIARHLDAQPEEATRLFTCRVGRCAVYALSP